MPYKSYLPMERASCQGDDKSGPQDMLPYSSSMQKGWGKRTSTWVSQAPHQGKVSTESPNICFQLQINSGGISAERLVAQWRQCKSSPALPCFPPFPLTISCLPKPYHRTIYKLTEFIALCKACNFSSSVVRI